MPVLDAEAGRTRWRGVPHPDRRARRRQQLVEVTFDLLGTRGWAATSVRGVCRAAQLNQRYFYESFEDLDALVVAVFDQLVADALARVLEAIDGAGDDPHAQVAAAVDTLVRFVTDDPRRARVLFVEALGNERLMRRRLDTMHTAAQLLEREARRLYGDPPPGERIATVTATLLIGGAAELLVSWLDGRLDITREQLVADMTALFVLTGEGAVTLAAARARKEKRP
jgi:AcrR family transcriptional regulator